MFNPWKSLKRVLGNPKGFNLTEVMVSSAIAGFVAIGASSLYIFVIDNFRVMVGQNAAQESLLWTSYQTRSWVQQSVGFYQVNPNCFAGPAGSHQQLGANTGASLVNPVVGNLPDVGADESCHKILLEFQRQNSFGGTGSQVASQISVSRAEFVTDLSLPRGDYLSANRALGKVVFFRQQGGTSPIRFPVGVPSLPTFNNSVWYDRISNYSIDSIDTDSSGVPSTITFDISARYWHRFDNSRLPHCTDLSLPCGGAAASTLNRSFTDLAQRVVVSLRNFDYDPITGGLHGNLFYYRFMAPPMIIGLDF